MDNQFGIAGRYSGIQGTLDGIQEPAEEMLEQKDIEYQQIIEQIQTECQEMLEEKEREVDNDEAKMTRRLRDSGQENVAITEQMRQLQEEIRGLKDQKFTDCKFDEGPTILEKTKIGKLRYSLDVGVADRTSSGRDYLYIVYVLMLYTNFFFLGTGLRAPTSSGRKRRSPSYRSFTEP